MKIVVARMSGFCMGVRRAVEMILDAPETHPGPICTFGPLIHNPQVLELLASRGVRTLEAIPDRAEGTVLIRAHGVPPETKRRLREVGFRVIDATCPRVVRVQSIIRRHARKHHAVIILGDPEHPEVVGLLGYAGERGVVVSSLAELERLPPFPEAILVAQTTQNTALFQEAVAWLARRRPHYKVYRTICDSTERRQEEVMRLAAEVDALIVVGGKSSGNTRRLFEIARETGKPAFHIEDEGELAQIDAGLLARCRAIGITAGASTPNWVIRKVILALENAVYRRKSPLHKAFYALMRASLLTNGYISIGAAGLCHAASLLQGIARETAAWVAVAYLYVQSMHILNHLTGSRADRFNEPDRARFYERRKIPLTAIALACGAGGLCLALWQGAVPFVLLLAMSLLGLSYRVAIWPARLSPRGIRRLQDIPGSKTVLIALAWGVVTALLPAIAAGRAGEPGAAIAFAWIASLVFVRTAFFDLLDMQGDRLVGKETIPILLGERRTRRMLKAILAVLIAGLPLATGAAGLPAIGHLLALSPAAMLAVLLAWERGAVLPGVRLEFLVESHILLAGALALLWGGATG